MNILFKKKLYTAKVQKYAKILNKSDIFKEVLRELTCLTSYNSSHISCILIKSLSLTTL